MGTNSGRTQVATCHLTFSCDPGPQDRGYHFIFLKKMVKKFGILA